MRLRIKSTSRRDSRSRWSKLYVELFMPILTNYLRHVSDKVRRDQAVRKKVLSDGVCDY